jgi:large subunit ribosomal protein L10
MPSATILKRKQDSLTDLGVIFQSSGVYMFDYRGLKVSELEDLRRKVKALNSNLKIVKNRLAIKYFEKENRPIGREIFEGPTAIVYSTAKFVEVAKVLTDFERENKKIKIKSGLIEQRLVTPQQILEVAKLPSKEQLLAQLIGSIAMPLKKFGMSLSSPLSHMLILMKNLKEKKEKGG